jgi:hypothetical protein
MNSQLPILALQYNKMVTSLMIIISTGAHVPTGNKADEKLEEGSRRISSFSAVNRSNAGIVTPSANEKTLPREPGSLFPLINSSC